MSNKKKLPFNSEIITVQIETDNKERFLQDLCAHPDVIDLYVLREENEDDLLDGTEIVFEFEDEEPETNKKEIN